MSAPTTAEEELRKSKALLEQTQRITKVGGWEYDVPSRRISWTDEVYRIYEVSAGFDPNDIPKAMGYYSPKARPVLERAFRRAVEEGEPYDLELQFIGAKGTPKWVRTIAEVERVSGKTARVFGNIMDVTERKRAEQALKESEERFRTLVENIPNVAVQGYALDGTVLFWNRASALLYGYSAAEAMGGNLLDLIIPPEMREGVTDAIRQMAESGVPLAAGELSLMRKDGSRVPVFSSHALIVPPGRPVELFCLDIDLTERKRAEEELLRARDLLLRYVRHSPIYTFIKEVTPIESRVLYASDNFEQMVGIPGRDITGMSMAELFPAEFAAKITADDWAVVTNGGVLKLDEDFNGRNYTSIKFPVIQGEKTLLAGYTIDITDRKKSEEEKLNLERQVQQAQKLESLGVLAGGIAHDFNNLLMVVLGHAELALGAISPMSPARNSLTEISTAARRAADLSQQMLA
jgi:two-component system cell cycle sensor histidine kinase/response regulator CckA